MMWLLHMQQWPASTPAKLKLSVAQYPAHVACVKCMQGSHTRYSSWQPIPGLRACITPQDTVKVHKLSCLTPRHVGRQYCHTVHTLLLPKK